MSRSALASSISNTRNIGILAHIDAGKTTTTERILFYSGVISRLGEVDDGSSFTDWMEQEQERGISITAASTTFEWANHLVNLIDTPGHVDFTMEVERSLRVLDGAIMVFSAVEGVQSQSETVWRQADRYGIPRLAFVNKCDRTGADPIAVTGQLRDRLGASPLVLQLPIGLADTFSGLIDLISMTSRVWDSESLGVRFHDEPISDDYVAAAESARTAMLEQLALVDDEFLAAYLASDVNALSASIIKAAIRRATLVGSIVPVLVGSAYRNIGVHNLLDAVADFLPSPADLAPVKGHLVGTGEAVVRTADPEAPLVALAFKVTTDDANNGQLTYVRVYAGRLTVGSTVLNTAKSHRERIERLVRMHANHREDIDKIEAGDIGAIVGGRTISTGDTLADLDAPIVLDAMHFPAPVIGVTIEPPTAADEVRLRAALERLAAEDPSLRVGIDDESGATTVAGMGELHLEILLDRIRREFGVDARVGRLVVAYRETVTKSARAEARHTSSTAGQSHTGHVMISVAPAPRGDGYRFESHASPTDVPAEFVPAVEEAVSEAVAKGVIAGFPMTDLTVALVGGSHHVEESSSRGYKIAGTRAFRDAARAASPAVLEPVMDLEVRTPDSHMGDILGDLLSRRAKIVGLESRPGVQVITATVPLAEMVGYATGLRSGSRGRATYSMQFKEYAEVPISIQERLVVHASA